MRRRYNPDFRPGRALWVKEKNVIRPIPYDEIGRAYHHGGKTMIYQESRCLKVLRIPLSLLEKKLPPRHFLRIHRKHLINKGYFVQYHPLDNMIILLDGSVVPLSRRNKTRFKEFLHSISAFLTPPDANGVQSLVI